MVKLIILLPILILSSCINEKKTPYQKYLKCLKEYPETGNENDIHKDICFNKFSYEGFGLNITGFGPYDMNTGMRHSQYNITNQTSQIVKVNQIELTLQKKNNTDENNRTVEVLYCEPKKILPNDSKQIKCSYGNVDPQDYMNKYRAIKSNERDASWKISSSSHLDIQN